MFLENNKGAVYYSVNGPEKAPLVVFTHGITMDHTAFDDQVDALQGQFQVLVWDLPGHGLSFSLNGPFSYSLAEECLIGLLDELDAEQVVTVGVSLGGQINQYLAHNHPERVSALVEVGSLALHKGFGPLAREMGSLYVKMSSLIPKNMVYSSFSKSKGVKTNTQAYLKKQAERMGKDQLLRITKDMVDDVAGGISDPVKQPLLIVHGEKEAFFVASHLKKWHDETPGSRFAVIPDAGHVANMDNPEFFNKVIGSFLEEICL